MDFPAVNFSVNFRINVHAKFTATLTKGIGRIFRVR